MKLFIVAALISVCAAGRLEHLERSYLPPNQGSQGSFGSQRSLGGSGSFGTNGAFDSHGLGSQGSHGLSASGSFDSNGIDGSGASGRSLGNFGASAFPGATSNQYLPPNHGSAGNSAQFNSQGLPSQRSYTPQNFGSTGSFGSSGTQYSAESQYSAPSSFGASSFGSQGHSGSQNGFGSQSGFGSQNGFGSQRPNQGSSQYSATNRQYLAPKSSPSFQNTPQQPFDEETGYHY